MKSVLLRLLLTVAVMVQALARAQAQDRLAAPPTPAASRTMPPAPQAIERRASWVNVPRIESRLSAPQIGLVINDNDPYSVAVGEYYIRQRGLTSAQVLRLRFESRPVMSTSELEEVRERIRHQFGPGIQALALAWRQPWAVSCNSVTSAISMGLQESICRNSCDRGQIQTWFNQPESLPFTHYGWRPSMLIAASSVEQAKALIDRGLAADGSLGRRFAAPVNAMFVNTADAARSVRGVLFPPASTVAGLGLSVSVSESAAEAQRVLGDERLLLYQTGAVKVEGLERFHWVPGAVADHLTSFAGVLDGSKGHMPATAWIDAGATASYGTVSEPCNHLQKFPHPQLLLQYLMQGSTVLEAYWRSVAWPAQGLFVGDPLAAPFGLVGAAPLGTSKPAGRGH